MTLPDVDRLLSLPEAELRALGERLRALALGPNFAAKVARVGERLDDALRAPMRVWHARRLQGAAAIAGRLFVLHDPVRPEEARSALGDVAPLLEAGLLEEGADGLTSPVHLALAADALCFGDRPGRADAVPPICGATIELARAVTPPSRLESALDLGCGAGPVALLLARVTSRVVATDVSPRAIAFARLNLRLNGVENVELRQGNLFEPVLGDRFDRIAAHPPFVARPEGAQSSTFVHGGVRGDELPLRMLAGAAPHLAPGGRAVVLADWPILNDSLEARVRSAVGEVAADVLVLQSPLKNLDEYCALLAAVEHDELGPAYAGAAIAHREHLDRLGLRGLALGFVVVAPGAGWTSAVSIRHVHDAPVTAEAIERLIAARRLALGPSEGIAAARLRFPTGARFTEQPLPDGSAPSMVVQPPAGHPEWPAVIDGQHATMVKRIVEASRVDDAGGAAAIEAAREGLLRSALAIA